MKKLIILSLLIVGCKKNENKPQEPAPTPQNVFKEVRINFQSPGTHGSCQVQWDYKGTTGTSVIYPFDNTGEIIKSVNSNSIHVAAHSNAFAGGSMVSFTYSIKVDGVVKHSGKTNMLSQAVTIQ